MSYRGAPATGAPAADFWQTIKVSIDAQEFAWLPPWPWFLSPRERQVRLCRRLALRLIRRQHVAAPSLLLRCLAWPAVLPVKAWRSAREPELGRFWQRFWRGWRDLVLYNLRSEALRPVRSQRPDKMRLARLYVADRENQALLIALNETSPDARIGDKIAFAAFCAQHHLPHIPILSHGHGDKCLFSTDWSETNLFVKASNRWCGLGAESLMHDPARGEWLDRKGRTVTPLTVAKWAGGVHGDEPWLIQPMLHVDPTWAAWSPGPLGTVRIVTVIVEPGGIPEIVAASMRLPRKNMVVDNFSAGALSAEIDWRTGELKPALSRTGNNRWHDVHPDTGGRITGAMVPRWNEMRALAVAAHAAAPRLTAIGWDLSCHGGKPILIEANPVFNIAPTVVLGETRWLEAILNRISSLSGKETTHE